MVSVMSVINLVACPSKILLECQPMRHLSRIKRGTASPPFGSCRFGLAFWLVFTSLLPACSNQSGRDSYSRANTLWKKGRMVEACPLYEKALAGARGRLWYASARRYVLCMARTGQLGRIRVKAFSGSMRGRCRLSYLLALMEIARGAHRLSHAKSALRRSIALCGSSTSEPSYRLALLLMEDERYTEALPLLESVLASKRMRRDPGPRIALARAYVITGRSAEAVRILRTVPDMPLTRNQIRRAQAVMALVVENAAPMTRQGATVYQRATAYLDQNLEGQASRVIEQVLNEGQPEPALFRLLGIAHLRLGNTALAVIALRKALALNPQDGLSATLLGVFFWQRRQSGMAEKMLRLALRRNPVDYLAHITLGEILLRTGGYIEASQLLSRAANLSEKGLASMRLWAMALIASKKYDEAEMALNHAVKKYKKSYELIMLMGDLYSQQYKKTVNDQQAEEYYRRAKKAYRRALALRPGDVRATQMLKKLDRKASENQ